MDTMLLMTNIPAKSAAVSALPTNYLIGGIIAVIIFGYLVFTLMWPEKF